MDWIKNNSVTLTEAIRQVILAAIVFGVVQWTEQQTAGLLMAVSAILALFTRSNTISTAQLDQRVTERVVQREAGLPGPGAPAYKDGGLKLPAVFLAVAMSGLLAGCASTGGRLALVEDQVHDSLARVDDQVRQFCGRNDVGTEAPCRDVRAVLIPTLETGAAFNRAVAEQKAVALTPIVEAIGRLIVELKKLPESHTVDMIRELARAISSAYTQAGGAQ